MPSTVNGCGTALVKASPDYNGQYDAIEAVVLLMVPLLPYKAIHVTSIWDDYNTKEPGAAGQEYRYIPLRFSPGILFRGMLNGWARASVIIGPIIALFPVIDRLVDDKKTSFNAEDVRLFVVAGAIVVLGGLMKLLWFWLSRKGSLIKRIIYFTEGWPAPAWKDHAMALGPSIGCSDPFYWPKDVALDFSIMVATREGTSDLNSLVERYLAQGDWSSAMLYARLALRLDEKSKARALQQRIIQGWRAS